MKSLLDAVPYLPCVLCTAVLSTSGSVLFFISDFFKILDIFMEVVTDLSMYVASHLL